MNAQGSTRMPASFGSLFANPCVRPTSPVTVDGYVREPSAAAPPPSHERWRLLRWLSPQSAHLGHAVVPFYSVANTCCVILGIEYCAGKERVMEIWPFVVTQRRVSWGEAYRRRHNWTIARCDNNGRLKPQVRWINWRPSSSAELPYTSLMSDSYLLIYALAILPVILILSSLLKPANRKLSRIPTIGPSAPLLSYYGVYRFLFHGPDMIRDGYNKHKGSAFKIADLNGWHVIIGGPSLVEELRKAGDDQLSSEEALNELVQTQYTLGPSIRDNPYHIPVVRSQLTRNLAEIFPEVHDEIIASFTDAIPLTGDEWTAVPALDTIMQVICRTTNRIFVGLPKCRNPDYSALNVQFTIDVAKGAMIIKLFPNILRPIAARLFTNVNASISRGVRHLEGMILERYRAMEEFGDEWPDKPNDMLQWLMDVAQGEERTVRALVLRILAANFAAIHSSSMTFTQALYCLAANPDFVGPLREEVDTVISAEGWSKAAMDKMRKIDSFLKESQRFAGMNAVSMWRKALRDVVFGDGTFIPAGTMVSVAAMVHHDEAVYAAPDVFDPWRFASMRDEAGEGRKHQMATTSVDYIAFGHGRHACPGRFFAVNEMKAMLAHVVMTYDVKMEEEGVLPPRSHFGTSFVPNRNAKVLFRKRQE